MRVRIRSLNKVGTLAELPNGETAQVYVGKLRLPVALADLEPVETPATPTVRTTRPRPPEPVPLELDLHGLRVEEAQPLLDKYIDDALLAGYDSVRILHGKGTGALRQMVWDYLKRHPQVRHYYHPPTAEGGEGTTVVVFKKR